MTFWIIVSLLALAVAALLVLALLGGRTGAEPAAAYDLRVYRDQLKDVERDLARGREAGFTDYVAKFDRDGLVETLRQHVASLETVP